jgi:hypothetical protein
MGNFKGALLGEIPGGALGEVSNVGVLRRPTRVEGAGSVDALETVPAEEVSLSLRYDHQVK